MAKFAPVDHYEVLMVSRTANYETIKAQYFHLSQIYHPNKYPGQTPEFQAQYSLDDCTSKFQDFNNAFWILRDPVRRMKYDNNDSSKTDSSSNKSSLHPDDDDSDLGDNYDPPTAEELFKEICKELGIDVDEALATTTTTTTTTTSIGVTAAATGGGCAVC